MQPLPLQPRTVALRDLDGLEFPVVVLRVQGEEADVVYLDDSNVERLVPLRELTCLPADDENSLWVELHEKRWEEGLAQLAGEAEAAADIRPATAQAMRWEEGRYVDEAGAVFISAVAEAAARAVKYSEPAVLGAMANVENLLDEAMLATAVLAVMAKDSDEAILAAAMPAGMHAAACGGGLRGVRNLRRARQATPVVA